MAIRGGRENDVLSTQNPFSGGNSFGDGLLARGLEVKVSPGGGAASGLLTGSSYLTEAEWTQIATLKPKFVEEYPELVTGGASATGAVVSNLPAAPEAPAPSPGFGTWLTTPRLPASSEEPAPAAAPAVAQTPITTAQAPSPVQNKSSSLEGTGGNSKQEPAAKSTREKSDPTAGYLPSPGGQPGHSSGGKSARTPEGTSNPAGGARTPLEASTRGLASGGQTPPTAKQIPQEPKASPQSAATQQSNLVNTLATSGLGFTQTPSGNLFIDDKKFESLTREQQELAELIKKINDQRKDLANSCKDVISDLAQTNTSPCKETTKKQRLLSSDLRSIPSDKIRSCLKQISQIDLNEKLVLFKTATTKDPTLAPKTAEDKQKIDQFTIELKANVKAYGLFVSKFVSNQSCFRDQQKQPSNGVIDSLKSSLADLGRNALAAIEAPAAVSANHVLYNILQNPLLGCQMNAANLPMPSATLAQQANPTEKSLAEIKQECSSFFDSTAKPTTRDKLRAAALMNFVDSLPGIGFSSASDKGKPPLALSNSKDTYELARAMMLDLKPAGAAVGLDKLFTECGDTSLPEFAFRGELELRDAAAFCGSQEARLAIKKPLDLRAFLEDKKASKSCLAPLSDSEFSERPVFKDRTVFGALGTDGLSLNGVQPESIECRKILSRYHFFLGATLNRAKLKRRFIQNLNGEFQAEFLDGRHSND